MQLASGRRPSTRASVVYLRRGCVVGLLHEAEQQLEVAPQRLLHIHPSARRQLVLHGRRRLVSGQGAGDEQELNGVSAEMSLLACCASIVWLP